VKAPRRHYAQPREARMKAPRRHYARYRCPGTSGRRRRIPLSDHRQPSRPRGSSISPFWRHPAAWSPSRPRAPAVPIRRYRCPGTSRCRCRIPLSDHRLRETRPYLISFLRWKSSTSSFWRHPAAWSPSRRERALPHALPHTLPSSPTRQLRRGIWRS